MSTKPTKFDTALEIGQKDRPSIIESLTVDELLRYYRTLPETTKLEDALVEALDTPLVRRY